VDAGRAGGGWGFGIWRWRLDSRATSCVALIKVSAIRVDRTAAHFACSGSENGVDIPAKVMTRLIRPVTLAGVVAVLLSSGTSGAGAVARKAVRAEGRQHPAQDEAPRGLRRHVRRVHHRATSAHEAVIGGIAAQAGAFPSVVEIEDSHGNGMAGECTGTVVAPSLILTAGHCAENMKTGIVNKATGYRVFTDRVHATGVEGQVSAVSWVIAYEGLDRRVDDGDAALLVLSTPTTAPAIRLATGSNKGEFHAGVTATIVGWGNISYEQRLSTERLRSADTVVQGPRWCSHNGSAELCHRCLQRRQRRAIAGPGGRWKRSRSDRYRDSRLWKMLHSIADRVHPRGSNRTLGTDVDRRIHTYPIAASAMNASVVSSRACPPGRDL